jgi:nucleotide-binding universal stress UspA family protein
MQPDLSHAAADDTGRIVVGVDGSAGSATALRWAITQALVTKAGVEVIASWQDPLQSGYSLGWMPMIPESQDWADITQTYLDKEVAQVVAELGRPDGLTARAVQGHPAQVLLEAAAHASLLVVGSRGHGTLAGMLAGSVSQHCVLHAPCPVVVVPMPSDATARAVTPAAAGT